MLDRLCVLLLRNDDSDVDLPDAPAAPTLVSASATSTALGVQWLYTTGNSLKVDYYNLEYQDTQATTPTWTLVTCDNNADGNIATW